MQEYEICFSGFPKKGCQGCHISKRAHNFLTRCTSFWSIFCSYSYAIVEILGNRFGSKNELWGVTLPIIHWASKQDRRATGRRARIKEFFSIINIEMTAATFIAQAENGSFERSASRFLPRHFLPFIHLKPIWIFRSQACRTNRARSMLTLHLT